MRELRKKTCHNSLRGTPSSEHTSLEHTVAACDAAELAASWLTCDLGVRVHNRRGRASDNTCFQTVKGNSNHGNCVNFSCTLEGCWIRWWWWWGLWGHEDASRRRRLNLRSDKIMGKGICDKTNWKWNIRSITASQRHRLTSAPPVTYHFGVNVNVLSYLMVTNLRSHTPTHTVEHYIRSNMVGWRTFCTFLFIWNAIKRYISTKSFCLISVFHHPLTWKRIYFYPLVPFVTENVLFGLYLARNILIFTFICNRVGLNVWNCNIYGVLNIPVICYFPFSSSFESSVQLSPICPCPTPAECWVLPEINKSNDFSAYQLMRGRVELGLGWGQDEHKLLGASQRKIWNQNIQKTVKSFQRLL